MLSLTEIKVGTRVEFNNEPYEVLWRNHSKIGRGGAVLRTKMRNLKNSKVISHNFQGNESLPEADLSQKKAQYLYFDNSGYHFMDEENYEQFTLRKEQLGNAVNFLREETSINILVFKNTPINVDLPIKIDLKVVDAPPAFKGNTADGGSKIVKVETGFALSVPLFIKNGDTIKINTETGEYVERV